MLFAVSLMQLLLAALFALAGIAKLVDRAGTRRALEAFGAPASSAHAAAFAVSFAELAVAAALIPAATALWGAGGAIALLAIFSLAIARVISTGATPDCNCFGGLAQTEVGRGALLRNLLLAVPAGLIAVSSTADPVSALHWIGVPAEGDRLGVVVLIALVAGLGCFCWRLLQQNGRLLLRLDQAGLEGASAAAPLLGPGSPAPYFAGRDLQGETVSLESLLSPGLPVALFFTDPGCGACELALDTVAWVQRERAEELTVAVFSSGRIERIEQKAEEFGLERVVPQADEALFNAYSVNGVPGIVEIDERGTLTRGAALGVEAVRGALLGVASNRPEEAGRR